MKNLLAAVIGIAGAFALFLLVDAMFFDGAFLK